jgi:hypothetical protein
MKLAFDDSDESQQQNAYHANILASHPKTKTQPFEIHQPKSMGYPVTLGEGEAKLLKLGLGLAAFKCCCHSRAAAPRPQGLGEVISLMALE